VCTDDAQERPDEAKERPSPAATQRSAQRGRLPRSVRTFVHPFACATRLACSPLPLCRLTLSLEISLLPRNHIPFLPCLSPLLDLYPSPSLFLISPNHPTDGCAMSDLRPPLRPFTTSSAESTTSSRGTGVGVSRRRHCLSIHPSSLFPIARLLLLSSEWTGVTICTLAVCPDAIA
jgi:hypothetical protein